MYQARTPHQPGGTIMGLDATLRTINTNATTENDRLCGGDTLATFRKFYPLHKWVADNIEGAEVETIDGYPVIVTAELTANDVKRAYADITDYLGAPSEVDGDVPFVLSTDTDLFRLRQAYEYALSLGAGVPALYYAGDC